MSTSKKLLHAIATIAFSGGLFISGSVLAHNVASSAPWAPPTCTAPNCNVAAPINVGGDAQARTGKLGVGTGVLPTLQFEVSGDGLFSGNVTTAGTFRSQQQATNGSPELEILTSGTNPQTFFEVDSANLSVSFPESFTSIYVEDLKNQAVASGDNALCVNTSTGAIEVCAGGTVTPPSGPSGVTFDVASSWGIYLGINQGYGGCSNPGPVTLDLGDGSAPISIPSSHSQYHAFNGMGNYTVSITGDLCRLIIGSNNLTNIDTSSMTSLLSLEIDSNGNPSGGPDAGGLNISNEISSLSSSDLNSNLEYLETDGLPLTSFNLGGLSSLNIMRITGASLGNTNLNNLAGVLTTPAGTIDLASSGLTTQQQEDIVMHYKGEIVDNGASYTKTLVTNGASQNANLAPTVSWGSQLESTYGWSLNLQCPSSWTQSACN